MWRDLGLTKRDWDRTLKRCVPFYLRSSSKSA